VEKIGFDDGRLLYHISTLGLRRKDRMWMSRVGRGRLPQTEQHSGAD
jgi:hypothetical protein